MGVGALSAMESSRLAAWAWGPPSFRGHRDPRSMSAGAFSALESSRPMPHGRWGLVSWGIIEAPVAWARGAHSF